MGLAAAAIEEIKIRRQQVPAGTIKIAYILDSIKHPDEVELLRVVYDQSFRLIAVHCDLEKRMKRLIGSAKDGVKYAGAKPEDVVKFMERDEKDILNDNGQRVRDVFHLGDFFLDNTIDTPRGSGMNLDLQRFIDLVIGRGLVRPTQAEKGIFLAHAASLQSSCLSRQVGAALFSRDGNLISTGSNDPPKAGGGIYTEDSHPDNRCMAWEYRDGDVIFKGCHNDRRKDGLYSELINWLSKNLSEHIAGELVPRSAMSGLDLAKDERDRLQEKISSSITSFRKTIKNMPGVKDLIEFSRAIHAEMDALINANRNAISVIGGSLYVTTFPCHSCARHLVAAGVREVFYIEPYVKSLAFDLHSDAIVNGRPGPGQDAMLSIAPFTGVGPRMYEDFFVKRGELKGARGVYAPAVGGSPFSAVRLRDLDAVEAAALKYLPVKGDCGESGGYG